MILLVLGSLLISNAVGNQLAEVENCDSSHLDKCVKSIPKTRLGLPRNKAELDSHCLAYNIGMSCMNVWINRCLPTDGQQILKKQIGGAQAIMHFLCNETELRKDFLKEPKCWNRVSPYWSQCIDELSDAAKEIDDRAQRLTYYNRNSELCCARDDFLGCVADIGRICSNNASSLMKRIALVLAQDIGVCNNQRKAYCAASQPPFLTPLLTVIYIIVINRIYM